MSRLFVIFLSRQIPRTHPRLRVANTMPPTNPYSQKLWHNGRHTPRVNRKLSRLPTQKHLDQCVNYRSREHSRGTLKSLFNSLRQKIRGPTQRSLGALSRLYPGYRSRMAALQDSQKIRKSKDRRS